MELQFQVKSVVYALLFASALVMCVFTAVDFFDTTVPVVWQTFGEKTKFSELSKIKVEGLLFI